MQREQTTSTSAVLVNVGHTRAQQTAGQHVNTSWSELRRYLLMLNGKRIFIQFRACSRHEKIIIAGALVQTIIVAVLQALILTLADVESLDSSRKSYVFFFFFTVLGGLIQAVVGILNMHLLELGAALMLNVLNVIYASLQLSELYGDREPLDSTLGILAAVSCAVLTIIVLVDAAVLSSLYEKFAQAAYTRLGFDSTMQEMYHNYKAVVASSTLLSLLNTTFIFVHLVIYLSHYDVEGPILLSVFVIDTMLVTLIRFMKHFSVVIRVYLAWLLFLASAYLYKIIVFDLRECSFCGHVPNMLFLSFSATINLVLVIFSIGLTVRCLRTFKDQLTHTLGRLQAFPATVPLPSANQRLSALVEPQQQGKTKPAFVTTEFRFQRVSSHRSSIIPINIADSARFHSPTHRLLSSSET
eukprot:m.101713 g.101713  ORF g.101713 m.101713 type:complete len:413 (+) comp14984_c1_seq1:123-1361(+)